MSREFEQVRDFLILHYVANERHGEPFWDCVRNMSIPESLQRKIDLFKHRGRFFRYDGDLFSETSWVAVFFGQNIIPAAYNPLVDGLPERGIEQALASLKSEIDQNIPRFIFITFGKKQRPKTPTWPHFLTIVCKLSPQKKNKFTRPLNIERSPLKKIVHAFQFDASLYAKFLRKLSEDSGTKRIEGKVVSVGQNPENGHIQSLTLEDGQVLQGDFFIDCTGFAGLLIEKTLKAGYKDWSELLPVNHAVACACTQEEDPIPYTRATAKDAGWQWRIPLQHRLGNGYVFSNKFLAPEAAEKELMESLEGSPLADPKHIKFTTGHRKKFWEKNCLSLGLAAGFMEPLESTSIHLIQTGLSRLMAQFPDKNFNQKDIDYYNRRTEDEYIRVRDFLILHYKASVRTDTPFWQYIQNAAMPDKLREKIELYKENGRIFREDNELFNETSWLAVMHGQGLRPKSYHPVADVLSDEEVALRLTDIYNSVVKSADYMPTHIDYIRKNCEADKESFAPKPMGKTRRVSVS